MPNAELQLSDWVGRARGWLATYGDPEDLRRIADRWNTFHTSRPVVTLFGAYDSGKSSLLRRVLLDSGLHVPEWLTISARHETFEASDIEFDEITLRDTPGISAEATDARGVTNTETALRATALTDVLVVVVPPQLPTGELQVIRNMLNKPWRKGSLWFAISRFDEAGVDPTGDPDGYRRLAEAKPRR